MAKQITRWKPDTCKCIIDIEWDTTNTDSFDNKEFVIIQKCQEHQSIDDAQLLTVLSSENVSKNKVLDVVMTTLNLSQDDLKTDKISFSFDNDRKITFNIKDLSDNDKLKIENKIQSSKDSSLKNSFGSIKMK
jgi:hypothetical protein